jgi:hypothetical protein
LTTQVECEIITTGYSMSERITDSEQNLTEAAILKAFYLAVPVLMLMATREVSNVDAQIASTPTPTPTSTDGPIQLIHLVPETPPTATATRIATPTPQFWLKPVTPETFCADADNLVVYHCPEGLLPTATPTKILTPVIIFPQSCIKGDVNNDRVVNVVDFSLLRAAFGTGMGEAGYNPGADFNGDRRIDVRDFSIMRGNYGLTCGRLVQDAIQESAITATRTNDVIRTAIATALTR